MKEIYVRAELQLTKLHKGWGFKQVYTNPLTNQKEEVLVAPLIAPRFSKKSQALAAKEALANTWGMAGWWKVGSLDEIKCDKALVFERAIRDEDKAEKKVLVAYRFTEKGVSIFHTQILPSFTKEEVEKAVYAFLEQWYEHKTKREMKSIAKVASTEIADKGCCLTEDGIAFSLGGSILP